VTEGPEHEPDPEQRPDSQEPGGNEPPGLEPGQFYRLAWGFYLFLALVAVVWIGSSHDGFPLELFVDPDQLWADLGLGVAAGLSLVLAWRAARHFFPGMRRFEEVLVAQIGPLDGSEVFALAVISGIAEELLFRGAIQSSWGFFWATAIFTFMHSGPGRVFRWWTLFALVAGCLFGGLTHYRGNLLPAVVGHFVVNAVNLRELAVPSRSAES